MTEDSGVERLRRNPELLKRLQAVSEADLGQAKAVDFLSLAEERARRAYADYAHVVSQLKDPDLADPLDEARRLATTRVSMGDRVKRFFRIG